MANVTQLKPLAKRLIQHPPPHVLIVDSALFIDPVIEPPRESAANIIPVPTIARIRASYSAENAPERLFNSWAIRLIDQLTAPNCMKMGRQAEAGLPHSSYAAWQLAGELMQLDARFIEPETALPRARAARAIAPPTMARISAYSAAEAPDSSLSIFMKVVIVPFLLMSK